MKKTFTLCTSLLVLLFIASCSKSKDESTAQAKLKITMGIHCGWNLRLDSLNVDEKFVALRQNYFTNGQTIKVSSNKVLENSRLQSLENALDWGYFSSLNYNSGDLGSDGCDIWLRVNKGSQSHEIRFSPNDTIPQLRAFTDQLDSLWSTMGSFPSDMLDNF